MATSNLGHFVLEATAQYRDLPAFILKEPAGSRRPISFFEFNETVLKLSHWLRTKYPKPGFKAGLWGENRVEWCASALAIWHAGGVVVPLMHIATDTEVKNIIGAARLDVLFVSPKLQKTGNFGVREVFKMDFKGDLLPIIRNPLPSASKLMSEARSKPDDMAVLIFTSGTTGNPKGVKLTHRNIITNILDVIDLLPTFRGDRTVSILPLAHMFELVGGFTIAHMKGICISYPDSLKPEDVLGEMRTQKANLLVAVPLFFEILDRAIQEKMAQLPAAVQKTLKALTPLVLKFPGLGKVIYKKVHDVFGGGIRFFVTGGAKIDPEVIKRFQEIGIQVLQGYGLTETSPIISFTRVNAQRYGSVGQVVASVQLKIDAPNENGDGEICVAGPSIFAGYFENPEATAQVMENSWFHTGDLGRLDQEGFLFITGRKKDMIVTPNGKNVYPEELEEVLKTSPMFNEVAVFGIDNGRGEEVHAVVVPSPQAPQEANTQRDLFWKEIERLCEPLSEYKRVQGMTIMHDELPKTATRKVRKHLLKERIKSGQTGAASVGGPGSGPHTPLNMEFEREVWLSERLQQITKKSEIWKEAHLRHDLGVDSLTFMELISAMESHWGVHIGDGEFDKIHTVDDLLVRLGRGPAAPLAQSAHRAVEFNYHRNNNFVMDALRLLVHAFLIRPVMRVFFNFKVINAQVLVQHKNFIMTPNHASHLDLLSVLCAMPLQRVNHTYAVAADDYFFDRPLKAFFVRLFFNAIPFERRARIDKGFRVCEEILRDGGNLVIFPEGTRSVSGQMASFKPGVGRLLASQGYMAVPAYIMGAHEAFPKGSRFPRFKPVSIYIGKPQHFLAETVSNDGYQSVADKLQKSVEQLRERARSQMLK